MIKLTGENSTRTLHFLKMWICFSYETPVAFYSAETKQLVKRNNQWGPTTGRHINEFLKYYLTAGNLQTMDESEFMMNLDKELTAQVMYTIRDRITKGKK